MPLRPCFLLSLRILPRPLLPQSKYFHTNPVWRNEPVNHYEALGLEPSASSGDIKKQFYSLSKTHHPDHNPNDPEASVRFMKISEAYAVLGNTQKRGRYDQEVLHSHAHSSQARHGSYSSTSSPVGARPASGLSRRRTQFRGPPPSFYRSGGWGSQREKRQAQAGGAAQAHARAAAASTAGGMGLGHGQAGFSNDVPHFDQEGHYRTQEQQEQRRQRRLREESIGYENGGSIVSRFLLIGGIVTLACSPFVAFGGPDLVSSQSRRNDKV